MPYLEKAGLSDGEGGKYELSPFDFRVKGVTSISCDTHKVGRLYKPMVHSMTALCSMDFPQRYDIPRLVRKASFEYVPQGTSVVMYRNAELRRHQYYINPTWTGTVFLFSILFYPN